LIYFVSPSDKMWWSCRILGSTRFACSCPTWWSQSKWKRSCTAWF